MTMFPKGSRLSRKKFKEIRILGRRVRGDYGDLFLMGKTEAKRKESCFAVVVGERVFRKATDRNKLKRQAVGILREAWKDKDYEEDAILVLRSQAASAHFEHLRKWLTH